MKPYTIITLLAATMALTVACAPSIQAVPTEPRAATQLPAPMNTLLPPMVEPTAAAPATPRVPFPVTWTVRETTNADGRTIYIVDDMAIVRAAQEGYERLRDYYTFPNGLPLKDQLEKDAAEFTVDPDRARGMVDLIESWRQQGGYWIYPPSSALKWEDTAEFNADGAQMTMALFNPLVHNEWFDLALEKVTYVQESKDYRVVVVMLYSEQNGLWKVLSENSTTGSVGPTVVATSSP